MNLKGLSIILKEEDLLYIINSNFDLFNIGFGNIYIDDSIYIENIEYKKFKNLNLSFKLSNLKDNKIVIQLNKVKLKVITIPKCLIDIILKYFPNKILNKNQKNNFILDIEEIIKYSNVKFKIKNITRVDRGIKIDLDNIFIYENKDIIKNKRRGINLKLTQTTLRLSGEDIMSFVKDFVKMDNFILGGVDISQAVYIKGIIVNSFEVGDVSIDIKDLKGNLIHINIKPINTFIPGVNIEHIPIRIYLKDLIKSFSNLDMDMDLGSVRFVDGCLEVKVNNFKLDVKRLISSSSGNILR